MTANLYRSKYRKTRKMRILRLRMRMRKRKRKRTVWSTEMGVLGTFLRIQHLLNKNSY
jgi:hypothetical protein